MSVADLYVQRHGAGAPWVFLHAFPLDSSMWSFVKDSIVDLGIEFISIDLPGFGKSRGKMKSIPATADAIVDLLASMKIPRTSFCGLSMGGYVLCELIRNHRGLVKSAVFCDTTPCPDSPEKRESRIETIQRIENDGCIEFIDEMIDFLVSERSPAKAKGQIRNSMMRGNPESMQTALSAMAARNDNSSTLSEYRGPLGVIFGEDDPMKSEIANFPSGSNVRTKFIQNAGHFPPLENPFGFVEAFRSVSVSK